MISFPHVPVFPIWKFCKRKQILKMKKKENAELQDEGHQSQLRNLLMLENKSNLTIFCSHGIIYHGEVISCGSVSNYKEAFVQYFRMYY
mmetsp:Transcript_384/g.742  ORF Transcript_384/g.742 Transcript_384/m.742 type:complete len:89 (+) Transcript_384:2463-2729(+)